jgi:hypothetical protein
MRLPRFAAAAVVVLLAAQPAHAQNLIYNPGFEIGSLDGWTSPNGVMPARSTTPFAHAGQFAAEMPSVYPFNYPGPPNYQEFGQTLATTPGQSYDISFFAENTAGNDQNNGLRIIFGGVTLFDQALTNGTWQQFAVQGTASTASTWFEIDGFDVPGSNIIDDVSVTATAGPPTLTPEPATLWLVALGALALGEARRRAWRARPV